MRRVHLLCWCWVAALVALCAVGVSAAAEPPLPPPVSVGPLQVKAVRWLAEGYNPVWASDGSFFVVSRAEAGFFRYASDGSREARLGKNTEAFCDLSPDGKSVLYCQTRVVTGKWKGRQYQIRVANGVWLMRTDGTGRRLVNKKTGFAKWSSDGRYFLCQAQRGPTVWGEPVSQEGPVSVYDRSGKLVRQLDYAASPPSWSGDGQYLAYVGKAGKIYLARGDGSSPKVADQPTGGEPYARLWWSPRGHNLLYAWKKQRYGIPTGPLCHLAPGRTPIEICDTFRTVIWSPSGDRAVATSGQGLLTAFAFPKGKDPEVLFSREPGADAIVLWSGDGRSLFYTAQDGLWLASAESEEDRPLSHQAKLFPLASLTGGILVCTERKDWWQSRPSLLDPERDESSPLISDPEVVIPERPATSVRAMVLPVWSKTMGSKLLLFQITRGT